MSQKKVDKYKQDKANRQKIMKREKVLRRVEITVAAVVLAALLVCDLHCGLPEFSGKSPGER